MKSKAEILKQAKKHQKEAHRNLGRQRENTNRCRAFYAGDYMEYMDKIQIATNSGQKKRVTVQINKIKPYVNAVKGFLAQNRRKPNYIARVKSNMAQRYYSMYANQLSEYLRGNMNADQVETQQDGDLLMCGLGAVETALSYGEGFASRKANGEVIEGCVDLDTFWWDWAARESGLCDSHYMGISKIYELQYAMDLYDDDDEAHFESAAPQNVTDYQYKADIGHYDRMKYDWSDAKAKLVNVHFYHWYDLEKFFRADNPMSTLQNPQSKMAARAELHRIAQDIPLDDKGKPTDVDFNPDDQILHFNKDTKKMLDESFGEFIEPFEFMRKVYYCAIYSNDHLFKAFKCEHQDGFSIKVKTGDFDAKNRIWTGMVNSMMEPQKYYNKALTELMFVIAANSKGGVIVEEDAVEDIEEFEDSYAKTDAVCVVSTGAISGIGNPKIKDKRQPFQPTGYEQIITLADAAIADVSGIDKTFLGSSENGRETAQLQRQRIRQIVATLACYVDSIVLFQKEHARLMLDLMRVYAENNRGDLFRILGAQGAQQFVELSEEFLEPEFDVTIGEAPVTPEEKDELAKTLTEIADKFLAVQQFQIAQSLYALAASYMPLDIEDIQEFTNIMSPNQQQMSPQQQQQLIQLVTQLKSQMSQAQYDHLQAETKRLLAEANKNNSSAQLDTVKAADLRAGVHKKSAETAHVLEEAAGKHLENKWTKGHAKQVFGPEPTQPTAGA